VCLIHSYVLPAYFAVVLVAEYRRSCRVQWSFSRFRWTCKSVQCYSKVVSIMLFHIRI